jgi:membrane protease YdiL (CAAX protease family)
MNLDEYLIAISLFFLVGSFLSYLSYYKKIYKINGFNFEFAKRIKFYFVLFASIPLITTRIDFSTVFPNIPSFMRNGWINLYINFMFILILIYFIRRKNLKDIFFQKGKYIGLAVYTLILGISWAGLTTLLSRLILMNFLDSSKIDLSLTQDKFLYNFENNIVIFFGLTLYALLLAPIYEEIIFRGFIQNYLSRYLKPIVALSLTSLAFSFIHYHFGFGLSNLAGILSIFVLSMFIGFLYQRTGSLIACMVLHSLNNCLAIIASILPSTST